MRRRTLLTGAAAATATGIPLAKPYAQRGATVRWWYHFDDPKATPAELVAAFEKANPGITVQAENIPWNGGTDYDNRLYASILAGNGPDTAMVRLSNLARLVEMEAILPLDKQIDAWAGRTDIPDDLWSLHKAPDGKRYLVPLQLVMLFLYVRQDILAKQNLPLPKTWDDFLNVAKATTTNEQWGYGLRGGGGGQDAWMNFVFGTGAKPVKGGFTSKEALAQNKFFIDLHRVHKVCPPSSPTDGFVQIINNLKAGRTVMTVNHISSANDLVSVLGDGLTAVPSPRGPNGTGWSTVGDGSCCVFSASKNPEAAFKWISWLSTSENNVAFNRTVGQLTVTKSGAANWPYHPKRFVDATVDSIPIGGSLPTLPAATDFVRAVWPQTTQKALLGQISPDEMMQTFEKLFFG